jgi:hypothetical protein
MSFVAAGTPHPQLERGLRVAAVSSWAAVPVLTALVSRLYPVWAPVVIPLDWRSVCCCRSMRRTCSADYGRRAGRRSATAEEDRQPSARARRPARHRGAVWEVAAYAEVVGRGRAAQVGASVDRLPLVTIYAKSDIALDVPGVHVERLDGDALEYRIRYRGLHLLQHTGGKYFLLPDGWRPGSAPLVVIEDDGHTRLEFIGAPLSGR